MHDIEHVLEHVTVDLHIALSQQEVVSLVYVNTSRVSRPTCSCCTIWGRYWTIWGRWYVKLIVSLLTVGRYSMMMVTRRSGQPFKGTAWSRAVQGSKWCRYMSLSQATTSPRQIMLRAAEQPQQPQPSSQQRQRLFQVRPSTSDLHSLHLHL